MKKLIALVLAIILGCNFTACTRQPKNDGENNSNPPVIDDPMKNEDSANTATTNEKFLVHISTSEELLKNLQGETEGKKLVLDNDIDCTNVPWKSVDFSGELDGCGYSIKNLKYIVSIEDKKEVYLCGFVHNLNGIIHDIVFDNIVIDLYKYHISKDYSRANIFVGGVCGRLLDGKISNVTVKNSQIKGYYSDSTDYSANTYSKARFNVNVGGFVGTMTSGIINDCTISNSTIYDKARIINFSLDSGFVGAYLNTGGLIGSQFGGVVIGCKRSDDVKVSSNLIVDFSISEYNCFVGGIVASLCGGTIIEGCTSTNAQLTLDVKLEKGVVIHDKGLEKIGVIVGNVAKN